jgi:hypothetical protein
MYSNLVLAEKVEHKSLDSGSELWEISCVDNRQAKNGNTYCAYRFKATFWGSTQPCEEGAVIVICGDLVNDYYTNKNNQTVATPKLNNPRILDLEKGKDITPQKEEDDEEDLFGE